MVEFAPSDVAGYKLTPSQVLHKPTLRFRSHLNKVRSKHAHFYFSPLTHFFEHPNQFAAFPYRAKYFNKSCCTCVIDECNNSTSKSATLADA